MEAKVNFYGCSCGCTPCTTKIITSETREGLLYGLANTILDYRVHGGNPYRKCNWHFIDEPSTSISDQEITNLAEKIFAIEEEIRNKELSIKKNFNPIYTTSSPNEYPLTPEQEMANKNAHDAFLKAQEAVKEEIKELEKQKASFYVAHSVNIDDDDDD